jgi:hypothetical protein
VGQQTAYPAQQVATEMHWVWGTTVAAGPAWRQGAVGAPLVLPALRALCVVQGGMARVGQQTAYPAQQVATEMHWVWGTTVAAGPAWLVRGTHVQQGV